MKKLDLTKYKKKKIDVRLRKIKIKTTSRFKPVKKRMKKIDLTKNKKKMSCSLQKTQNKIDLYVLTCKKAHEKVRSDKI